MLAGFRQSSVAVPFADDELVSEKGSAGGLSPIEQITSVAEKIKLPASAAVTFDSVGAALHSDKVIAASKELFGHRVHVLFQGTVTNYNEICELYGVTLPEDGSIPTCAELMLHLYSVGFADIYGDDSDQPATLLGALQGDFVILLHDAGMGYVLAVRSQTGGVPLYWGLDSETDQVLFSTVKGACRDLFPSGIVFESQVNANCRDHRFLNITRKTPATRGVNTISKIDSQGHLCGMIFKSKSGCDLSAASGHYDVF